MATLTISLPDPIKSWAEARVGEGGFESASDYVGELIRRDHERLAKIAAMQRLIDEARAAGVSDRTMADVRDHALARLRAGS